MIRYQPTHVHGQCHAGTAAALQLEARHWAVRCNAACSCQFIAACALISQISASDAQRLSRDWTAAFQQPSYSGASNSTERACGQLCSGQLLSAWHMLFSRTLFLPVCYLRMCLEPPTCPPVSKASLQRKVPPSP